ncbi:DmsE family decaheme c-type cytochrome [Thauera mechernichensis]
MFTITIKRLSVALLFAGLSLSGASALAEEATDIIYAGDAKCTSCHDELEVAPVLSIAKTKHGVAKDGRAPSCTTCHGESEAHANKPEDVEIRPATDLAYGKKSHLTAAEQSASCISCHQGGKHMNWNSSAHARSDVSCTSCHQVHTGHDLVRDKRSEAEVCYACHKQQRAEVNRPSHHPIPEGKMTCSDCHNAHGSAGEKMLVKDTTNATCYTCHADKRGPFIHNHQPVTEDCGACHNPHGTTAEAMLKSRAPFLCMTCHGDTSHHGAIPGVAENLPGVAASSRNFGIAQARGCLNCHTNIHGSNNPHGMTSKSGSAARFYQ